MPIPHSHHIAYSPVFSFWLKSMTSHKGKRLTYTGSCDMLAVFKCPVMLFSLCCDVVEEVDVAAD